MATTTKTAKTENPPEAKVTGPSDVEILDAWVKDVRKRILDHEQGKPFVGLHERLLAMQWELSSVKMDAVHFQGYSYHSIQSIENHVNRLSAIYRVRITPHRVGSVVLEGGVRLHLQFTAYCYETEEHTEWEWEDDGEDLTKAGSYTQKYGLMKFFHVGDGQDPDAEAERGKPRRDRASATRAGSPIPKNGGGGPVDAGVKEQLYELARTLPATAGWGFKPNGANVKIDAQLDSKAFTPEAIRKQLVEAHVKAHGADCEHVKATTEPSAPVADAGEEPGGGYPG